MADDHGVEIEKISRISGWNKKSVSISHGRFAAMNFVCVVYSGNSQTRVVPTGLESREKLIYQIHDIWQ